jgi:hypothetical protein
VVRLVSSAFGSGHDWDQELEDTRDGWRIYLRNLRLYLTRYPGWRCSWIQVTDSRHARVLLLRLDEPAPGSAVVAAFTYGGEVYASLHAYLFGDQAPAVAAREQPAWRAWMAERFPSAAAKAGSTAER